MFKLSSLTDKLQEGVGNAFSLDHLQEGDEWLEEGEEGDIDAQRQPTNDVQDEHSSTPATASTAFQDQQPPKPTETPTVAASTPTVPATATSAPKAAPEPSPPEASSSAPAPHAAHIGATASKARPSKAKAASTAMSNFFSLDAMQEEDPWMKNGPTANERFDATRVNSTPGDDGEFNDETPVAPMVPYGSGFDEDASNESDNDELDDLLLSSRRGRIYTPGSLPPPRSSPSPTPDAAAAAAALVATPQLNAASFEAQSRMQEKANAAAVAAAVEANGILPPLSETTTQSSSGATNSATTTAANTNTRKNKDSGLLYSRPQTLVLREEDEEEWLSPTKPAPPPSLFEPEDHERSSSTTTTVAEAHRVVDLYHVDSRPFETPMSAPTNNNQYLRGLHVPPTPPHSRLGDDVAEALTDQQDDGGRHSWLRRAMPRSDLTYGSSSSFMEAAQPVLPLMGGYMGGNGYAAGGGGSVPALGGEGGMSPVEYGAWMAQHFAGQMAAGAERFASSNLGASGTAPRHGAQAEKKVEDHFSLLLQREGQQRTALGTPWRLTTVNKFQIAVVVAGCCLAYFYYTLRGYFVLT